MSGLGVICGCCEGCPNNCGFKNELLDVRTSMSIEITVTNSDNATWENGVHTLEWWDRGALTTNDRSYFRDSVNNSRQAYIFTCSFSGISGAEASLGLIGYSSLHFSYSPVTHIECSHDPEDVLGMFREGIVGGGGTSFDAEVTGVTIT